MTRGTMVLVVLTLVCASSFSTRPTDTVDRGELTIYSMTTQNGTGARRVFKDALGRTTRIIYYAGGFGNRLTEDKLTVSGSREFLYDQDGYVMIERDYSSDGVPRSEIRRSIDDQNRETKTTLIFNRYDGSVVGLYGLLPDGVELTEEWGDTVANVRCSVSINRPTGSTARRAAHVLFQNVGSVPRTIESLDLEIHDSRGVFIPNHQLILGELVLPQGAKVDPARWHKDLAPGHVDYSPETLYDWYRNLPLGDYTLRVQLNVDGADRPVVSNTVPLKITAQWQYNPGREFIPE